MKRLSYQTLKELPYDGFLLEDAPEKVLQFGEGNFLRAFVDYFIDLLNEKTNFNGKVAVVQPRPKRAPVTPAEHLNAQEGLFTLYLRGFENGQKVSQRRILSCISRCLNAYSDYDALMQCAANPDLRYIVSNTTEAGIVYDPACTFTDTPAGSFPGKLTQFLYRRFELFGNTPGKGFLILPCELIDDNGKALKDCVLQYALQWQLPEAFLKWLDRENTFCSTLVDRIVTGYPAGEAENLNLENGYEDKLLTTGECFGFWAIEGPQWIQEELPFAKAGLPVLITDNYKPYKQRKVRILNGAHTSMVLGAYLAGQSIVRDCMQDEVISAFLSKALQDEIIPTLTLPLEELQSFAASVTDRFKNPFIDHSLLAIALNSTSKWKARVLPTVRDFIANTGSVPRLLVTSFALYAAFYRNGRELTENGLLAVRPDGTSYVISDDPAVLQFFLEHRDAPACRLITDLCRNTDFWGEDLTELPGFLETALQAFRSIEEKGAWQTMRDCL